MRSTLSAWLVGPVFLLAGCSALSDFEFKFQPADQADGGPGSGDASVNDKDGAIGKDGGSDGGGCPSSESKCDDGQDDDCDTQVDCDDADCKGSLLCCVVQQPSETGKCEGAMDEDCDGLVDCADPDCMQSVECCPAPTPENGDNCSDGVNNDCDVEGSDCSDKGCTGVYFCTCAKTGDEASDLPASCQDGNDNDCDQLVDCQELNCQPNAACCTKQAGQEAKETECVDGQNDDCDNEGADCADSDCISSTPGSGAKATESQDCADPANCPACKDNIDGDCDGLLDCLDPDCGKAVQCCSETPGQESKETTCNDGINNDCELDGADCADPDCADAATCCSPPVGGESTEALCSDGVDNDCDTSRNPAIDCADAKCFGTITCCATVLGAQVPPLAKVVSETGALCNDGFDNDCDGKTNCADPDCGGQANCPCAPTNDGKEIVDGKDNDCDGYIDFPPNVLSSFPQKDGAAAGKDVSVNVSAAPTGAVIQCRRVSRRTGTATGFVDCGSSGSGLKLFSEAESKDPKNDGAWRAEFRYKFPGGTSNASSLSFYVHSSMHPAARCTQSFTDAQWFEAAAKQLATPDAGAFSGTEALLTSPFVRITFSPPLSGTFVLNKSPVKVEYLSLRHRFTLDPTNKYLLIARNYQASRGVGSCNAASFEIHNRGLGKSYFHNNKCEVVVLNRAGAGLCLVKDAKGTLTAVSAHTERQAVPLGWGTSNKFMWRQLLEQDVPGSLRNFSPKCDNLAGCFNATFVPDRNIFGN